MPGLNDDKTYAAPRGEVSDPHPATEEGYDEIPRPGGARPPRDLDKRVNPSTHTGKPPPKPDYRRRGAE